MCVYLHLNKRMNRGPCFLALGDINVLTIALGGDIAVSGKTH